MSNGGNFKVRCVDLNGFNYDIYKINEIYHLKDGFLHDSKNKKILDIEYESIEQFVDDTLSKFELIPEPKQFTKADLRTGMRVELRNGQVYVILKDLDTANYNHQNIFLSGPGTFMVGSDYSNDLTLNGTNKSQYDIVNVFDSPCVSWILDINKKGKLLWQRPEPRKISRAEAAKILSEQVFKEGIVIEG